MMRIHVSGHNKDTPESDSMRGRSSRAGKKITDDELQNLLDILTSETSEDVDIDNSNAHYMKAIVAYNIFARGDIRAINDAAKSIIKACQADKTNILNHETAVDILYHQYEGKDYQPNPDIGPAQQERILKQMIILGKRAINLGSTNSKTFSGVGKAYQLQGKYERAIKYLQRALEIDPANMDAKIVAAITMTGIMTTAPMPSEDDYKMTVKYIDEVIASGQFTQLALTTKADLFAAFDDVPNLKKVLAQLERFEPTPAVDWMWRSELYMMAKDKLRAVYYWNRAKEIDPDVEPIHKELYEQ